MMSVSRRKFIRNSALLGVIAAVPLAAIARSSNRCADPAVEATYSGRGLAAGKLEKIDEPAADALSSLTQESFAQQLNTSFELLRDSGSAPTPLVLASIFDFKAQCGHAGTSRITLESFSLNFSCARKIDLPQGVYTLKHAELGSFALLLVPSTGERTTYEAVINRLHV